MSKHKYIILAGGFSGGPIKPLIAVAKHWREKDPSITPVIVDVKNGISRSIAHDEKIIWESIITGKIRRYWSLWNVLSPIQMIFGFVKAFWLLRRYKPVFVLGAGGFVQTPLIIMAWFMRIPRAIHQQDVLVTLSNRLCAPFANIVTTTFEFSIRDFPQGTGLGKKYIQGTKVYWTGNPTEQHKSEVKQDAAKKDLGLHKELPVLLVFGGGTGAVALNEIIYESLPELTKVVQVLHITGIGKKKQVSAENYHSFEFADDMSPYYAASDIVLGRAGLGTLTELAQLSKPSIIVPIPNSHQELNAELLFRSKAALVLDQNYIDGDVLINAIRKILFENEYKKNLETNLHSLFPKHASQNVVKLLVKELDKNEDR